VTLLAERENRVYRLDVPDESPTVLRIHRQDYHTDAELNSELQWVAHLAEQGMVVPQPISTVNDTLIETIDGYQIDRLSWLEGKPLGTTGQSLVLANREGTFRQLGETMARLHEISDHWEMPADFNRQRWGHDNLLGKDPLWGRFWENPQLSAPQQALLNAARSKASKVLSYKCDGMDYGLIHADLVRENTLLASNGIQLIDFDDGGWGYRLFELATALLKNRAEPDYPILEAALIKGYTSVRRLDLTELPLFTLLRAFTYVGWIMSRMDEVGSVERCERFITTAVELSQEYLDS